MYFSLAFVATSLLVSATTPELHSEVRAGVGSGPSGVGTSSSFESTFSYAMTPSSTAAISSSVSGISCSTHGYAAVETRGFVRHWL